MFTFLLLIFAYLLGSVPFGLVIGKKVFHTDLRQIGSGNIGTTNAFRGLGSLGGSLVFLCDMLKGSLPIYLAMYSAQITWHPLIFGFVAVIGHTLPLYLKFKGGKAIATSFGVVFAYAPLFALLAISCFFIVLYFSRMVSLSSIVAVFFAFILGLFWKDQVLTIITLIIWLLVVYRHKENILRIKNGTESKVPFGYKSKK